MNSIDSEFFAEYKRLEKLCAEIYSCRNGVTEYINEMNNCITSERYRIMSWNEDLNLLIHLRGLRNTLAHEDVDSICTEKDIADLKEFYNRILTQRDPLAELHRLSMAAKNKAGNKTVQVVTETNDIPEKKKHHFVKWIILLLLVGVLVLLFLQNYDNVFDVFYQITNNS